MRKRKIEKREEDFDSVGKTISKDYSLKNSDLRTKKGEPIREDLKNYKLYRSQQDFRMVSPKSFSAGKSHQESEANFGQLKRWGANQKSTESKHKQRREATLNYSF